MSLEKFPELGTKPVALAVKLPAPKPSRLDPLGEGLRELYKKGEFTDVELVCAERTFGAHKAILASRSEVFKQGLLSCKEQPGAKQEIRLVDVANPEAVQFMLDFLYQMDHAIWEDYNPKTQEITKDILRLARNFRLQGLTDRAAHWLAKDLTTGNVVERLNICEDFALAELKERILEQLTVNKKALAEVAGSAKIMEHPQLMQALLRQAATAGGEDPTPQPKKRGRKAA